jgi:hypothetical protein
LACDRSAVIDVASALVRQPISGLPSWKRHATVVLLSPQPRTLSEPGGIGPREDNVEVGMKRILMAAAVGMIALLTVTGPVGARTFGAIYANDHIYRVFGNSANVPDGTGTDPFATFTNSTNPDQKGVAAFAPGSPTGHHGGRWAVYRATWTSGDASTLVTSWSQLASLVASGQITLLRDAAADFRCPVLGDPEPVG